MEIVAPGGRLAVYSCYFGQHEPLNPAAMGDGKGYDRFLFTDDPGLNLPGVETVCLDGRGLPPALLSRKPKICPERYLAAYDWVIYVDNRAVLEAAPHAITGAVEKRHPGGAPPGRYLFRHPGRDCAYRELRVCFGKGLVTAEQFHRTRDLFRTQGLPRRAGLYVNTMMIQKMGDPATAALNEAWYGLFLHLCKRDQISLSFALWKSGLAPRVLEEANSAFIRWPVFSHRDRAQFRHGGGKALAQAAGVR